jgi:hypothetical protein
MLVGSTLCSAVVPQLSPKHMVHRRAYALEAASAAAVPPGAADSSAPMAAHPAAQQQQQALEAAPEDAAGWLRHIVDATAQQVPATLQAWLLLSVVSKAVISSSARSHSARAVASALAQMTSVSLARCATRRNDCISCLNHV